MNFFTANPIDKLFSLLSLSHFTEFYYDDNSVMQREQLFVLQDVQNAQKNKSAPKVHAYISEDTHGGKHVINMSFMVEKVDGLHFANYHDDNIKPTDGLWQETCLECFIGLADGGYIEMNIAPDGRYALYHFSEYRTPATPIQTDKVTLSWRADDNDNVLVYERHVSLDVSAVAELLPEQTLINPCAILNIKGDLHYFAVSSAPVSDFHDKAFWQKW
ncbi:MULTISPECIES: hypothetical protein [Moraxella]|uniref:Uncharacterized protein n=1 Tax=Moraxella lacunata TaxID=477 RepID=A0A1B8Q7C0_MORLA|nr:MULTISPECIES: hypothetical protein [Moraxella]MBE9578962.1 hypothetical protein [Moraxella sp. K1664]MBE9588307.1 hypothetical protein [Moraxella sp. K1630]MBE9591231.1 hypothetical protein [Moraxella sp. K127]MBE9596482.1 hypothetical protein [Moraxella sp. K2450]MDH9218870.1 hypothetical protein [Moraxella lacunata]